VTTELKGCLVEPSAGDIDTFDRSWSTASAWLVVVVTLAAGLGALAPLPLLGPPDEATRPLGCLAERPPTIATTRSAETTSAPPAKISVLLRPKPPWRVGPPRRALLLTVRG
jgi:hypothetical protein